MIFRQYLLSTLKSFSLALPVGLSLAVYAASIDGPTLQAPTVDTPRVHSLTNDVARQVVDSALEYATSHQSPGGAVAVVDNGGQLVAFARLDGSFPAASDVSVGKARTAALFRKPTRVFEDIVNKGRVSMVTLPGVTGFTPLQGGVPLVIDGDVVGAIGVSGAASAAQDDEIAQAAADALSARARGVSSVTHVNGNAVTAAFKVGAPLVTTAAYEVNASRRDTPGEAEVHTAETDIFYVLEGAATLVTGGALVEPHHVGSDEIRGASIVGGTNNVLSKGDVMVIPEGVPHWFKAVSAPFTYYVVKTSK